MEASRDTGVVDTGEIEVAGRPASWRLDGSVRQYPVVILAHGAGAPYTHAFLSRLTAELTARQLAVVRFHFPYMEQRVRAGTRRPPDAPRVLLATWEAMLDLVSGWSPPGPVVVAGKSMGGRIASMLLAEGRGGAAAGAIYFGYPLHPAGKPDRLRIAHLPGVTVPQLFVSGTRDPLCDLDRLRPVIAPLPRAELFVVDGGDHSLSCGRRAPWDSAAAWLDRAAEFARTPEVGP
ncbi:MAG: alpha/beta family hydrolase [Planctomycetota bacterium]